MTAPQNFQDVKLIMDAIATDLQSIDSASDFFPTLLKHIPANDIANYLAKNDIAYAVVMASAKIQRGDTRVQ
jgi:hypothetical protein